MKKVSLIVRDKNQDEALSRLRRIGVVHIEKRNVSSDLLSRAFERKTRAENAMALILPYKPPKKKKTPVNQGQAESRERRAASSGQHRGRRASDVMGVEELEPYSLDAVNAPVRPDLVNLMVDMGKDRKAMQDRQIFLAREYARIKPWGNFKPAALQELADAGIPVFLYELTPEAFAALPAGTKYILMGRDKTAVRLAVLDAEIAGAAPFPMPEKSLREIETEQVELIVKLDELEERIKTFADRRPVLKKEMAVIESQIEFEAARAALECVDDIPEEYRFSYLTGFAPAESIGQLKNAAAENGWALVADDPEPDDQVPTKLKNSRLTGLLYPLTDFLEVVPGYNEVDISGWFLLFFCIFFGMIFGDAGYGFILMLTALIGMLVTAKKGVPPVLKMLLLLSVFNAAWGVLTCSWFGVDLDKVPLVLQNLSLPLISSVEAAKSPEAKAIVDQNLQIFCFSLGLLQLTIAHLKGVFRYIKSLKVFAEIGSLAMLWGMYNVVLFLVVSNSYRKFPLLDASIYLLAGGFVLTFIFAAYEGNLGQSILSSCKNLISVVLGITNVFSDIMSYIRLWAVGLAGASIATTVNTMAGPMLGSFLVFVGMILLVFGHGLNLILNVLSVLVHGVRLNTLEFSGHLGLTWSGTAYRPFAETAGK
jgi:V/A-type H+-transporting ATPase subunit I